MCSNRCMCSDSNNNANNYSNMASSSYNSYNNSLGNSGFSSTNYNNTSMNYGNAYVPYQPFTNVFSPANGLANGTMFPELVSPYCPNQSLEIMNYLKYNSTGGGCCR